MRIEHGILRIIIFVAASEKEVLHTTLLMGEQNNQV